MKAGYTPLYNNYITQVPTWTGSSVTVVPPSFPRLLLLIELPSLDGVLTHDAVDGRHIALNVARVVGGACSAVGGACSSAAQTCLAAVSGSSHYQPRLPPPPPAPASHVTRRRSSGRLRSPFHTHHHHHWHRVSSDSTHHGERCEG